MSFEKNCCELRTIRLKFSPLASTFIIGMYNNSINASKLYWHDAPTKCACIIKKTLLILLETLNQLILKVQSVLCRNYKTHLGSRDNPKTNLVWLIKSLINIKWY